MGAPSSVGRFEIVRELGRGGMGVVYEAHDEVLDRRVAVKLLSHADSYDRERRARLVREARAAAAVTHAHVAVIHDVGEDDGHIFIAMELVEGETFAAMMKRESLPLSRVLEIATQMASGLRAAHARGVYHRDLKPQNVMIDGHGDAKLLDFGLAKLASDDDVSEDDATASMITLAGQVMGTPGYMAPEQAEGKEVSDRADVFSFGALIYEALTGSAAFGGDSSMQRIASTLRDEPAPLPREVPGALKRLVGRCLSKNVADRPSAAELVVELEQLRDAPAPSPRFGRWLMLAVGVAAAVLGTWAWQRRSRVAEVPEVTAPTLTDQSIIGCPFFGVKGYPGSAERLGAVAAAMACGDIVGLVADPDRVRRPAELLDLPKLPLDDFPASPFGSEKQRLRALAAAKELDAWVEGELALSVEGCTVRATLVGPEGAFATTTQSAPVPSVAVSLAMASLLESVGLVADEVLPLSAGLSGVTDRRAAQQLEHAIAGVLGGVDVDTNCALAAKLSPSLAANVARRCGHYERDAEGLPTWPSNLAASLDALPVPWGSFWRSVHSLRRTKPEDAPRKAEELDRLAESLPPAHGAIVGSIAGAMWLRAGDQAKATAALDASTTIAPHSCDARVTSLSASYATPHVLSLARAATAWCPQSANGWMLRAQINAESDLDLDMTRVAFVLRAGNDPELATSLVMSLLQLGRPSEAHLIASRFTRRPKDAKVVGAFLQGIVEIASRKLRTGLTRMHEAMDHIDQLGDPQHGGSDLAMVQSLMVFSELLGEEREVADEVLNRYVNSDQKRYAAEWGTTIAWLVSYATPDVGREALARIRKREALGEMWRMPWHDAYHRGLEHVLAGEDGRAAKAWRGLAQEKTLLPLLRADVFDRAGEHDMASSIDRHAIEQDGKVITMAHVREARRAAEAGDVGRARKLAKEFVDTLSGADVKVFAVDEMRKLAAP